MSKLVIHVGTHKTGTTSIQDTLALNRELLATAGLIFPQIGQTNGQHGLVTDWIKLPQMYQLDTSAEDAWMNLARKYGPTDLTVLISSEELSRGTPSGQVDMARIRELCDGFDEIRVICCVRNQISLIQSIFLQVAGRVESPPWQNYFSDAVNRHLATGVYLDYLELQKYLQTGFSQNEIQFFTYESATASEGGVIGKILHESGFPSLAIELENLQAGNSNVSRDPLATWVAAHVAAGRSVDHTLFQTVQKTIDEISGPNRKTSLFTRAERDNVKLTFETINQRFEESQRQQGNPIRIEWPAGEDVTLYRDELKPAFWVHLARNLHYRSQPAN